MNMADLEQTADIELQPLSREQFGALTMRVIQTASDGTTVNDAICATAGALGALISVTGQQDGVSRDDLLKFCLESVTTCATCTA
jgi:hypothetical protein